MRNKKKVGVDVLSKEASRHTLDNGEQEIVKNYRQQKSALELECQKLGIDPDSVKKYWYKSDAFTILMNTKTKGLKDLKEEMISGMNKYSPKFPKLKRPKSKDSYLLVIDPADIHLGKLGSEYETGDSYNVKIAVDRVLEGVEGLLQKTSGFNIDQIVLILGNDILHTDTPKATTTKGTTQDVDGLWYDNFLIAQKLYVKIIEKLITVADVHIMHNVSNHDYMSGWMLSETIRCWFRKCDNVTFDTSMKHRKAFRYHNNLIGATHGDGAKQNELPILYAQEFKHLWAATENRYIYGGHVHHKTSKDYVGVTYETSRSVSGTDSWHHRNGYQHSTKAVEAYLHHKDQGQIARFTHKFE